MSTEDKSLAVSIRLVNIVELTFYPFGQLLSRDKPVADGRRKKNRRGL
jgi:hypothetical protein